MLRVMYKMPSCPLFWLPGLEEISMTLKVGAQSTPYFFEHSVKNRATFQRPATHARIIVLHMISMCG